MLPQTSGNNTITTLERLKAMPGVFVQTIKQGKSIWFAIGELVDLITGKADKPLTGSDAPSEPPQYEGQVYVDTAGGITYNAVGGKWVRDVQTMDGGVKGLTSNVEGKPYVQWAQIDVTADEVEDRNMEISAGYTNPSTGAVIWQGWGVYLASFNFVKDQPRPLYFGEKIDGETIAVQVPEEFEEYTNKDYGYNAYGIPITTSKDLLCDVLLTHGQFRVIRDCNSYDIMDSRNEDRLMVKKDPNRQNGYIVYFVKRSNTSIHPMMEPHNSFGICTFVLPECVDTKPVGGISVNGGIAQGKSSLANGFAAVAMYDGSVAIGNGAITRRKNQVVIKNIDGEYKTYAEATKASDDVVVTFNGDTMAVSKGVVYARKSTAIPYNVTETAQNVTAGLVPPTTKPDYVGQEYLDTLHKVTYKAYGTSSVDDWVAYGNAEA